MIFYNYILSKGRAECIFTVKYEGIASFEFRCKDNGIGMSGEFVKTIFDPFTRDESNVSGIQGTGLGMVPFSPFPAKIPRPPIV